jgi:AbrB family looped-hinge helix DNA binding protein
MAIAQSKVTAQGQISVPAEVRKKLGVGPGSILEWEEHHDPGNVSRKSRAAVKEGIRKYIRKKHARS